METWLSAKSQTSDKKSKFVDLTNTFVHMRGISVSCRICKQILRNEESVCCRYFNTEIPILGNCVIFWNTPITITYSSYLVGLGLLGLIFSTDRKTAAIYSIKMYCLYMHVCYMYILYTDMWTSTSFDVIDFYLVGNVIKRTA